MLKGLAMHRSDEQDEAPAAESVPEGQAVHCDCDVRPDDALYMPAGHGVGTPSSLWQ
jgi:hypothetical protein